MTIMYLYLILLAGFVYTHLAHGLDSWGLRPGGEMNSWLLVLLMVLALFSVGKEHFGKKKCPLNKKILYGILILLYIAWFYFLGYRVFTSIHNQGAENLLGVVLLSAIILLPMCKKK